MTVRIAEALRLLRTREGLTQTAASKREGAPDYRTLSHWETRRKAPSLHLLVRYLRSMGRDFSDLQEALDQVEGRPPRQVQDGLEELRERMAAHERRLEPLEELVEQRAVLEDLRERVAEREARLARFEAAALTMEASDG